MNTSIGGIVVSIVAFQAIDPGSIPGRRNFVSNFINIFRFVCGKGKHDNKLYVQKDGVYQEEMHSYTLFEKLFLKKSKLEARQLLKGVHSTKTDSAHSTRLRTLHLCDGME